MNSPICPDLLRSYREGFFDVGGLGSADKNVQIKIVTREDSLKNLGTKGGVASFDLPGFLTGAVGQQTVVFEFADAGPVAVVLEISTLRTASAYEQWQRDVWNTLYNAAQTQYYAQQQSIAGKIAQLEDQLSNVDTLTLRREESEEIMKGVLRYILGPGFDQLPQYVIDALVLSGDDIVHGVVFTGNERNLTPLEWSVVRQYEDTVRFINQAIEWENVVSFLYSYFWDVSESWDFIRQIRHPDAAALVPFNSKRMGWRRFLSRISPAL